MSNHYVKLNLRFFSLYLLTQFWLLNNIFFENVNAMFSDFHLFKFVLYLNNAKLNLIVIIYLFFSIKYHKGVHLLFLTTLIYCFLNKPFYGVFLFFKKYVTINAVLTNGLALIHPILVLVLYCLIQTKLEKKQFKITTIFFRKLFYSTGISLSFFALILGSFWAQQEMNWGGWWNWDVVELILFVYFLKFLLYSHINFSFFLETRSYNWSYYLLLFFIFARLDIVNSIHSFSSFNSLEKFFFFTNVIIYSTLWFYLILNFNYLIKYKNLINSKQTHNVRFGLYFISVYIYVIIIYIYYSFLMNTVYDFDTSDLFYSLLYYQHYFLINSFFFLLKKTTSILLILTNVNLIFFELVFVLILFLLVGKKNHAHIQIILLVIIYLISTPLYSYNEYYPINVNNVSFFIKQKTIMIFNNFFENQTIASYYNKFDPFLLSYSNFIYLFISRLQKNTTYLIPNISSNNITILSLHNSWILIFSITVLITIFVKFFIKKCKPVFF